MICLSKTDTRELFYSWSSNSEPKQMISASKYFMILDSQNSQIPNIVTKGGTAPPTKN